MTLTDKTTRTLWIITAVVAVALLAATVTLAVQANAQGSEDGNQRVRAYLQSEQPFVIILAEPEYRSTVASIQVADTPIIVTEYLRSEGEDWYQIDINEMESGWVQGRYISLERP